MVAPTVRLEDVTVRFGELTALQSVSLTLEPGKRHAVVGENGAGKSTLMKVLFGQLAPNEGRMLLDGKPVVFSSPRDAISRGIGMVHQHFDLIGPFTVAENVVLGAEPRRGILLDRATASKQVTYLAERSGLGISPSARVEDLSVAGQQRVEILKALYRDARVLILDEPTAVLSPPEAKELWAIVERLAGEGRSVVFITHKLGEVMAHADRVTVLRRGKLILEGVPISETTPEALAVAMVGESVARETVEYAPPSIGSKPALIVKSLSVRGGRGDEAVRSVSLDVFPGEIVGLAGVDGSGQTELIEALVGLRKAEGKASLSGADLLALGVAGRRALGLGFLPDDRLRLALAPSMRIDESAVLGRHREREFAGKLGVLKLSARTRFAAERIVAFDVRGAEPGGIVGSLSGGNQQKLVLARELSRKPSLLLAAQPTRGLDFAATAFVHDALRAERARGAAILVSSLDLSELLALCDRIAVMREGRLAGILPRREATEETLGVLMTGAADA